MNSRPKYPYNSSDNDNEMEDIQKRNEIVEEYIKCLDNKPSIFNSNNNQNDNNNEDLDDPFLLPVPKIIQKKNKEERIITDFHQNDFQLKRPSNSSMSHKHILHNNDKSYNENQNTNNIFKAEANFIINSNNYRRDLSSKKTSGSKHSSIEKINKKRNNTAKTLSKKPNLLNNNNNNFIIENKYRFNRVKTTKKKHDNIFIPKSSRDKNCNIVNDFINQQNTMWNYNYYTGNSFLHNNKNYYGINPNNGGINNAHNVKPLNHINQATKKREKLPEISKKKLKEKLNQLKNNSSESGDIPKEILEQFSTNRKNFYQVRKDIPEEDENEVNESEEYRTGEDKKQIVFPLIFKYFKDDK